MPIGKWFHVLASLGFLFLTHNVSAESRRPASTSTVQTPDMVASSVAKTLNGFENYESFWKIVKVKDAEAYQTLSAFLQHHGKEKIPAAQALGGRVYFYNGSLAPRWTYVEIKNTKPLEISYNGKRYRIRDVADAIQLLETKRSAPKGHAALMSHLFGMAAQAAAAAPAAAPVAAAVATAQASTAGFPFIQPKAGSRFEDRTKADQIAAAPNIIVDLLEDVKQKIECKSFLDGAVTKIPTEAGTFKLSYKKNEVVEMFTFPNEDKTKPTMQYRRGDRRDSAGRPLEDWWVLCKTQDCSEKDPPRYDRKTFLGEGRGSSLIGSSKEGDKVAAEFNILEVQYTQAITAYEGSKDAKFDLIAFAKEKKGSPEYRKPMSVMNLASSVVSSPQWNETAKKIRDLMEEHKKTDKKVLTPEPLPSFEDKQLKDAVTCLFYQRFHEDELYIKPPCLDKALQSFERRLGPEVIAMVIDPEAEKRRPLEVPKALGIKSPLTSKQDLYFLTANDAKAHEGPMSKLFPVVAACEKVRAFAKDKSTEYASNYDVLTGTSCLNRKSYNEHLNKIAHEVKSSADVKADSDFEAGPLAAAVLAGQIAQCCKVNECKAGIYEANLARKNTSDGKSSEPETIEKSGSSGGKH